MWPEKLQQVLTTVFGELGAANPTVTTRTLLLRDRCFVGQRFRCGDFRADLDADANVLEFFDAAGQSVRSVSLGEDLKRDAA